MPTKSFDRSLIIAAVDFSASSAAVYHAAQALACRLAAELRLLNVVEVRDAAADAHATDWIAEHDVAAHEVTVLPGTPWVQIIRYCEVLQPIFLVVGSHGRRGYQPLTPGSTTSRLLVRSPVPLLVVPSMAATPAHSATLKLLSERRSSP